MSVEYGIAILFLFATVPAIYREFKNSKRETQYR